MSRINRFDISRYGVGGYRSSIAGFYGQPDEQAACYQYTPAILSGL